MTGILLLLIFIRPFIASPAFTQENTVYSVLLLSCLLLWITKNRLPLARMRPFLVPLGLFSAALTVSLIFARHKPSGIQDAYKYVSGILLFMAGMGLARQHKRLAVGILVCAGCLVSVMALYQYFFSFNNVTAYMVKHKITNEFVTEYIRRGRVFFPFVTPNSLGGYLAMVIPLALAMPHARWVFALLCTAIIFTKSIGGLLALLCALSIYFSLQKTATKKASILLAILAAAIGSVCVIRLIYPQPQAQPAFSTIMRLSYWKDTWAIIAAHPLTGIGLGNFNLRQTRYAHNSYLQVWAETGIIGILALFWFVARATLEGIRAVKRSADKKLAAALVASQAAFLLHNFVDFTFFLPEISLLWWFILGMSVSGDEPAQRPPAA